MSLTYSCKLIIPVYLEEVASAPSFSLRSELASQLQGQKLVVVMIDPDAPTPQNKTFSQVRHFVGANFEVDAVGRLTNSTPAVSDFVAPAPPALSSPHRYVVANKRRKSLTKWIQLYTPGVCSTGRFRRSGFHPSSPELVHYKLQFDFVCRDCWTRRSHCRYIFPYRF